MPPIPPKLLTIPPGLFTFAPVKPVSPLSWMITEITAHSKKLEIYVGKIEDTIPPSSDIDVGMGVGVSAIYPELPLKNLVYEYDIICNVNGFDICSFTRRKMVKLLTKYQRERGRYCCI